MAYSKSYFLSKMFCFTVEELIIQRFFFNKVWWFILLRGVLPLFFCHKMKWLQQGFLCTLLKYFLNLIKLFTFRVSERKNHGDWNGKSSRVLSTCLLLKKWLLKPPSIISQRFWSYISHYIIHPNKPRYKCAWQSNTGYSRFQIPVYKPHLTNTMGYSSFTIQSTRWYIPIFFK